MGIKEFENDGSLELLIESYSNPPKYQENFQLKNLHHIKVKETFIEKGKYELKVTCKIRKDTYSIERYKHEHTNDDICMEISNSYETVVEHLERYLMVYSFNKISVYVCFNGGYVCVGGPRQTFKLEVELVQDADTMFDVDRHNLNFKRNFSDKQEPKNNREEPKNK